MGKMSWSPGRFTIRYRLEIRSTSICIRGNGESPGMRYCRTENTGLKMITFPYATQKIYPDGRGRDPWSDPCRKSSLRRDTKKVGECLTPLEGVQFARLLFSGRKAALQSYSAGSFQMDAGL